MNQMRNQSNITRNLYRDVIEDVIGSLSEDFMENGVDDDVRKFLKQTWTEKVESSKVMDPVDDHGEASTTQSNYSELAKPSTSSTKQSTRVAQANMISIRINPTNSSNHYDVKIPASAVVNGVLNAQLAKTLNNEEVARLLSLSLTKEVTTDKLQQIIDKSLFSVEDIIQIDGHYITDSEEDDDEEEDKEEDQELDLQSEESSDEQVNGSVVGDEYALDTSDDIEEEDFPDSDNVIVCQYAEIKRDKTHWKLQLKDGVMNINGRDYIFNKIHGEAIW